MTPHAGQRSTHSSPSAGHSPATNEASTALTSRTLSSRPRVLAPSTSTSIHVVDALEPLADEWTELADNAGAAPFLYPGWFRAWRPAFGAGALRLVTARRGGRLVGVVPMQARRGAWRSPTNAHTPGFDLLALDGEALAALSGALFTDRVRDLNVAPLDADG